MVKCGSVGLIAVLLLTGCTGTLPSPPEDSSRLAAQQVTFITRLWRVMCWGVAPYSDFGLWDDAPGAGLHNESAYFWFVTNDPGDEYCIASASGEGLSTTAYPQLS
ncbi:MAG: hypothetical protein RMJ90_05870, partial [Candidatus Bipolaricaulota bacterium]|nr:hypothetical protein [Candidatus Bipolaricaulota bacterium]